MKQISKTVSVKLTGVDGKEVEVEKPVTFPEYEAAHDVALVLASNDKDAIEELLSSLNYGANLKARAKVTAQIKSENQGPGVAIERMVKQLMSNLTKFGKTPDEKAIRAKIMASPEDYGIFLEKVEN